jgi:hypothetical protein
VLGGREKRFGERVETARERAFFGRWRFEDDDDPRTAFDEVPNDARVVRFFSAKLHPAIRGPELATHQI